jgi:hypothetical protein
MSKSLPAPKRNVSSVPRVALSPKAMLLPLVSKEPPSCGVVSFRRSLLIPVRPEPSPVGERTSVPIATPRLVRAVAASFRSDKAFATS